ncbi:MAG TPA: hypothetical protein VFG68_01410 [Fimbriiglobus sp.]|nr:hypothetical protein [Fimbriiglobus sp.]
MNAQPMTSPGVAPTNKPDALTSRLKQAIDGGPEAIAERLAQIDREWTTGRASKATAGLLIVIGLALTAIFSPWWLVLTGVGGLLLLPYLFGRRSPLGYVFHQLGLRRGSDIEQEKVALKALRGDFQHLPTAQQVVNPDDISRLEGEGGIVFEPEEAPATADDVVKEVIGATRRT